MIRLNTLNIESDKNHCTNQGIILYSVTGWEK